MAIIIGIDLGKFKGVACTYDTETQEAAYATIPTNPDALRGMLDRARPDLVVFEACTVSGRVALAACPPVSSIRPEHWRASRQC
ncbi:IS110 family transposase [Tautonia plasticadhaerens]|uniref:Uncharacterized protein n=1 Tax=Tautonia plasticadhaerens TaxID=2527974 RepID=A0A518HDV8_9BACT|nr:IS110 family transposase [Tautonia plasticadhaerens]QDV39042.1 hypothetical protein ElP_70040 [Tautonia plasticadhaerens]